MDEKGRAKECRTKETEDKECPGTFYQQDGRANVIVL
jgi:hypothetical protein